ncbi:MAG: YCF48-related protein [Bacteroidota bacterium]
MLRCFLYACCLFLLPFTLVAQDWTLQNPLSDPITLRDVYIDTTGFGWTGGEASKLYYTIDFGQSWIDRSLPETFGTIEYLEYVPGSSGQHLIVAGEATAYSLDAGQTWTEVAITGVTTGSFKGLEAKADTAIYLISNQGLLLKSADGGMSWNQLSLPIQVEWRSIDFLDANQGWLGSRDGHILQTADGGQTWTVLHDTTFGNAVYLDFLHPQVGFMSMDKSFFKTQDGGLTWDTLATGVHTFAINDIVAINEMDILVTQGARVAVSHDGGANWVSDFNHPYVGTGNWGLHAHPDGKVWAANRWRSLLYTTDAGDNWVDLFPAFKGFLGEIDAYDKKNILAAGSHSMMIRSQNGGLDWEELTPNLPPNLSAQGLEMLSDSVYVLVSANAFFSSRDAGQTWNQDTSLSNGILRMLTTDASGNLYALHSMGNLYHSTDSGRSWLAIPIPGTQSRSTAWLNRDIGLLTASAGRVFRTQDGGATWDTVQTGATSTLDPVTWASEREVWVLRSGFSDSALYSSDAGQTWTSIALPRRMSWRRVEFQDSLNGWIVGGNSTQGFIAETRDGGQTWTEVRTGFLPYFDVTAPMEVDTLMVWVCGSGGAIEFLGTLDTTTSDSNSTSTIWNQAATDWEVYPNPSQGSVSFLTPFGSEQPLSLQVFDIQGRQLAAYDWGEVPQAVDLSQLPSGCYLLRMHQGNRTAFRRWKKE